MYPLLFYWPLVCSPRIVVYLLALMLGVILFLPSGRGMTEQGSGGGSRAVATVTLTRADSGTIIEVRTGDTIIVRLDENPATGYRWAVEKHQEEVIALESTTYAAAPGAAMGGNGQRIMTFKVHKAGHVLLQLKRWRAWEGDTSIVERFTVTAHVQE